MRKLTILLFLLPATAQEDGVGRPFWVSTPPEAQLALDAARTAASNGDAEKAARSLQNVFDQHAREFVAQPGSSDDFIGARRRAVEMLRSLGADVRERYDEIFGPRAEEALRRALASNRADELREIVRRYEATPAGLTAIVALAEHAMQRGHPAEARLLLARIPELHPAAFDGDPGLRARLEAAAARDALQGGPPAASVPSTETEPGWLMMGGDATRTRIASPVRERPGDRIAEPPPAPAFEHDMRIEERVSDQPIRPERGFGSRRGIRHEREWERHWEEYAPVAPVVARGRLVYSDGQRIVALNLYTGDQIWSYPQDSGIGTKGRTNISQIFSPTILDDTVYGAIEIPVEFHAQHLQTVPITYYVPERRLVALDLETGEVSWSHEKAALPGIPADDALREELARLSIVGLPLVRGDRIYAPAAYSEGTIHTHLLAVDRHTGSPVYATKLTNGQQELNLFGRQLNELVATPVAEADGQLIFGTNVGVVCAVDAVLGSPLWARAYSILPIPSTFLWFEAPRRWPLLENGPPLIVGDRVVLAPADGRHVICLHRRTGRELWRIPADFNDRGFRVKRIHGTDGLRVFLGGPSGVLAVWIGDGPADDGRRAGDRAWTYVFPDDTQGAGRGVLARDGLWVPTYQSILRLDPESGRELPGGFEREGRDFDKRMHLFWADGALIGAGRDRLTVRYEREDVLRMAQEGVRRNPHSAEARLAAGDIRLAVGEFDEAARRYREALERARKLDRPRAERQAKAGLHRALLRRAFSELASGEEAIRNRAQAAFDAAFKAAPDDDRAWSARRELEDALAAGGLGGTIDDWRLKNLRTIEKEFGDRMLDESGRTVRGWALRRMAQIHVALGESRRAVADLQQLLERDPSSPDSVEASELIARIIRNEGRAVYEPFEPRAEELFQSTLKSGNLDALERGLRMYANAEAAAGATMELARRRLAANEPDRAAAALQRFLLDRPKSERVPEALQLLFRAYHTRNSHGPALAALQRLRRSHGGATVLRADGARIDATTWADQWLAKEPYASLRRSAHRLDLEPPLTERFARDFDGQYVDVPDLLGQKPAALRDAVLVRLGNSAVALDARNGRTLYALEFDRRPPQGPFVLANDRLLAATDEQVYIFDAATGRALAREPIPRGDEGLRLHEHRGQVFLLSTPRRNRGRGALRVSAIDPESGRSIWTRSIPREIPGERHNERFVTVQSDRLVVLSQGESHVTVLDTSSGAIVTRERLNQDGSAYPIQAPQPLPDGRILVGFSASRTVRGRSGYERTYEVVMLDPARSGQDVVTWRFRPDSDGAQRGLRFLQVAGPRVFVLERDERVSVLALRDGALQAERSVAELLDAPVRLADNQPEYESLLLLLSRGEGDEPARLFAVDPKTLATKYSLALDEDANARPAVVRSDGVVTVALVHPNGLRSEGGLRFQLVDALNARRIQLLEPPVGDASWYNAKVQNGILLVTLADRLVAYGPK